MAAPPEESPRPAGPGPATLTAHVARLAAEGRMEEARQVLRDAVCAMPAQAPLWVQLAIAEAHFGDAPAALACLDKAVQAGPVTAADWLAIGRGYAEHWRYPEADSALGRASALDPGAPEIETLSAFLKQEMGDVSGALEALARARARDPGHLGVMLGERLMLPQIYGDLADVARWRARYRQGLEALLRDVDRLKPRAAEILGLNHANFLLAYQGEDDTALQRDYAAWLGKLIAAARPGWRAPRPIRFDGTRRLRVGFVGTIFRDCTAGRYFERWVTGLDPGRFERFVYHVAAVADDFTQRIASASEHFAVARGGVREIAKKILADDLDVLVHPEVGMASVSYLLAAMRLAPVQAAGWGHPVTTGSDMIDYYFTCAEMEPADADAHYVERLVRLPGLGVSYSMPPLPPPGTRAEAGLPGDSRIYLCAQSLFKVHPEMDELLAQIAASDERAALVFFQAPARRVTEAFAARVQRALARRGVPPRGQLKFLPRMASSYFRRVLALADVVLDTPRWSGGNTSIDAFVAGVPVVTLPGRFMRGRQTLAMLRLMGLEQLVAPDADEYVRIALEIASDPRRNAALREAIAARRGVLFDRPEPVEAFAAALLRMGGETPARRAP
jgi:protein O-GlcNAc transferase